MATYRGTNNLKITYRINHQITAPQIRLIDEESRQIGVLTLSEAKAQATETGLDLVEIAPKANPPVVKLIDFSKFRYQESKKLKAEKKGVRGGELKEVQMTPFIGPQDFETRVKRTREFLTTGNKVKLSIKFQGRQITRKEFGYQLIERFTSQLADVGAPEGEPRLIGKQLLFTMAPAKKKKWKQSAEN